MQKLMLIIFLLAFQKINAQDSSATMSQRDLKIYPVLWQQDAAEYRALCYQAFNIARSRVDEITKEPVKQKLAIITDLDETILNNSDLAAEKIKEGKVVTSKWLKWVRKPKLPTVPGAVDFLNYAAKKGIAIFYISNRDTSGLQLTLSLLEKLELPDADTSHMLFLSDNFSKEPRRKIVMKDYNVIMLLGDNLNDFTDVFEGKQINDRLTETDKVKDDWGKKFIVLPNATYGDWENALFDYKDGLTDEQKTAMLKALLKGLD